MNRASLKVFVFVWAAACTAVEPRADVTESRSALLADGSAGTTASSLAGTSRSKRVDALRPRRLTELSRAQSRVVCEAADAIIDLCGAAGRFQPALGQFSADPDSCATTAAECSEQRPGPHLDCDLAQFDFGPSCTATVDDYLACLEDWNDNLVCAQDPEAFFFDPEVRAGCLPLLDHCPHFIPEYGDPATFIPHCDPTTSPVRVDDDDDVRGLDSCRPVPARMVALGDSIAACFGNSDPDGSSACAPDLIAEDLRQRFAPDLLYESHALPGAVTANLRAQAELVAPGPGHVLVWMYIGGNDLAPCVTEDVAATLACGDEVIARLPPLLDQVYDYFNDPQRFPDGATFLLNTQYALRDECPNPGGGLLGVPPELSQMLRSYNQRVFVDRAVARTDTVAIDQLPDFLGHGSFADNANCPYCFRDDNGHWLSDGVHPNATGQRHIAGKWAVAFDQIYGACDQPAP